MAGAVVNALGRAAAAHIPPLVRAPTTPVPLPLYLVPPSVRPQVAGMVDRVLSTPVGSTAAKFAHKLTRKKADVAIRDSIDADVKPVVLASIDDYVKPATQALDHARDQVTHPDANATFTAAEVAMLTSVARTRPVRRTRRPHRKGRKRRV